MGRSRPSKRPSGYARAVVLPLALIVGGLVWEQVFGPEASVVETPTQAAPKEADPRPEPSAEAPRRVAMGGRVRRGTITKIEAHNESLTATSEGEDFVLQISSATRVVDDSGHRISEPFQRSGLAVGTAIAFKMDGDRLLRIRVVDDSGYGQRPSAIRLGTIVSVDSENLRMTITSGNEDIEAVITEATKFFGAKGKDAGGRLRTLQAGADVMFLVRPKDGKTYRIGVRTASPPPGE